MSNSERRGRHDRTRHDRPVAPDRGIPISPRSSERGETTSGAILAPIVMLLMFAVIEFAIGWHAKSALDAAAEDGLRAAQMADADPITAAQRSAQMNARFVDDLIVTSAAPVPGRLTVTVTAKVPGPLPGLRWTISAKATGPLDRFRVQGQP